MIYFLVCVFYINWSDGCKGIELEVSSVCWENGTEVVGIIIGCGIGNIILSWNSFKDIVG